LVQVLALSNNSGEPMCSVTKKVGYITAMAKCAPDYFIPEHITTDISEYVHISQLLLIKPHGAEFLRS